MIKRRATENEFNTIDCHTCIYLFLQTSGNMKKGYTVKHRETMNDVRMMTNDGSLYHALMTSDLVTARMGSIGVLC